MKKAEVIERYGEEEYKRRLETQREKRSKVGCIKLYGEEVYEKRLEQIRAWKKAHPEEKKVADKKYREANPDKVKATHNELCRKGGKYYEKYLEDSRTGLRCERNKIRSRHANQYRLLKNIIAPESQLHHEWQPNSAEYTGLALVEAKPHQYGIIDVIQILDGKISLLTEEEVRNGRKINEKEIKALVVLQ